MTGRGLIGPYVALLRQPEMARMMVCGLLAAMPVGMQPLAILLLAREATGSYGRASIVVAGAAVGMAVISPLRGRAVDRRGAARVLPGFAVAFALAVGALIAAAELGAPTLVLAALALACGGTVPPVNPTVRALLRDWAQGDDLQAAFGLLTLMGEGAFLVGPAIVGGLVAVASPAAALAAMVVLVVAGTLGFTTSRAARGHAGSEAPPGRLGALRSRGLRVLLGTMVMWGATFGVLDVALPAFADERGSAATGGLLLSALSVGVAAGTFLYGTRASDRPLERRLVLTTGIGAASFAPLALATETWQLAALVFVVGLAVAAPTVCTWLVVSRVDEPETRAEAATWVSSAGAVGAAIGATATGAVVDAAGARTALLGAFVSSGLGFVALVLQQHKLRPAVAA
jgi:MFS family permease